jgi:predicted transcriptional regulator
VNLKSCGGVKVRAEKEKGKGAPEARICLTK